MKGIILKTRLFNKSIDSNRKVQDFKKHEKVKTLQELLLKKAFIKSLIELTNLKHNAQVKTAL